MHVLGRGHLVRHRLVIEVADRAALPIAAGNEAATHALLRLEVSSEKPHKEALCPVVIDVVEQVAVNHDRREIRPCGALSGLVQVEKLKYRVTIQVDSNLLLTTKQKF